MTSPVSSRLSEEMAPEVQEIIYRPRIERELSRSFPYLLDVNLAHAIMLVEQSLISRETGSKLVRALIAIEHEGSDAISRDPSREDVHFNFEATLISRIGSDVGGRIHIGRSRNDMGATIDRLRARASCLKLCTETIELREALLDQAKRHADVIMTGYTHLRPAQPITLGFYWLGIACALERDFRRIRSAYTSINQSPMGCAAFAGTSVPVNRERVAELLGFGEPVEHALDAIASRDFLLELAFACTGLGITLSRLAQDLYVWATEEFGLIDFPDYVGGTSSIMPQKKNPVVMEYLKGCGAENIGSMTAGLATIHATHFTNSIDGVRMSTTGPWQVIDTTLGSIEIAKLMVTSTSPREEQMLTQARGNFSTLTDLADVLVKEADISFREAHQVAGTVVRIALDRNINASQIDTALVRTAARSVLGRDIRISERLAKSCIDPARSIAERMSHGGASPKEVMRLADLGMLRVAKDRKDIERISVGLADAHAHLKQVADGMSSVAQARNSEELRT